MIVVGNLEAPTPFLKEEGQTMTKLRTKEELDTELRGIGLMVVAVSYEAYGREAFAYVMFTSSEERQEAENILREKEYPVNSKYWLGSNTAEIRIRKFAGIKE